jgi:hypothetical protein
MNSFRDILKNLKFAFFKLLECNQFQLKINALFISVSYRLKISFAFPAKTKILYRYFVEKFIIPKRLEYFVTYILHTVSSSLDMCQIGSILK